MFPLSEIVIYMAYIMPHVMYENPSYSTSLAANTIVFIVAVSGVHAVLSHYGFDLYFLTTSDIKQIFTCPLATHVSSCIKHLFISLPIKIIGLFVVTEERMIYILDTASLLDS